MDFNKKFRKLIGILFGIGSLFSSSAFGQIGIPSLKIEPGVRQAGMGGIGVGLTDDAFSLFLNPASLGHARQWQWGVAYTRWFADIYQASGAFSKQFSFWGSQKTGLGLTFNYLGMPSWDATQGLTSPVTANDFVIGLAFFHRMDWFSKTVALGMHLKSIQSRLDRFSASGFAVDMGFSIRPHRFHLGKWGMGVFDYGIWTWGGSISHLGPAMVFERNRTLLPTTWRSGMSLQFGRYRYWEWILIGEVFRIKNKDLMWGIGSEVWYKDQLGIRAGYCSNQKDLGDFSIGLSFRADDVMTSVFGFSSRFGDCFRFDLAEAGFGKVLQETYRGGISHYPTAPEPFTVFEPKEMTSLNSTNHSAGVLLSWEKAEDPDPFDEIEFIVLVDTEKSRIEKALDALEKEFSLWLSFKDSLLFCQALSESVIQFSNTKGGAYWWAVVAYDQEHHIRIAEKDRQRVLPFLVAVPDLVISEITFIPERTITTSPVQGELSIRIANKGSGACPTAFRVLVEDLYWVSQKFKVKMLANTILSPLSAGQEDTLTIPWQTDYLGSHKIRVSVDTDSSILELKENNNRGERTFLTIPKGIFSAPDSIEVMITGYSTMEVPLVPEVYFPPHSSEVSEWFYQSNSFFPALLPTLAGRMMQSPEIHLQIKGSIDWLSGERDPSLADARAEAVKRKLVSLGVPESRLEVVTKHPEKILGKRPMPKDSQDAKWVMEQNRVVTFSVPLEHEEKMFQPYQFAVDTTFRDSVVFHVRIVSPGGIRSWELRGETGALPISSHVGELQDILQGEIVWRGTDRNKVVVPRNRWFRYQFFLTDTLGREFHTVLDSIFLQEKRTIQKQEIFGAAKFGKTEPVYPFYWDRMMSVLSQMIENPSLHLRFEGHACAIGPEAINDRLSLKRASEFTRVFLERVKKKYPQHYEDIRQRVAPPLGAGEHEPLLFKLKGGSEILLGDNQTPIGRYLNRRIAILLYREH